MDTREQRLNSIDWMVLGTRVIDQHEYVVVATAETVNGPVVLTVRVAPIGRRNGLQFIATIDASQRHLAVDPAEHALIQRWYADMQRYFTPNTL